MMKSLVEFFFKQTLFGNLATAIVFIMGIISIFTIRKELFPNIDFDVTTISVAYPGASPEQVEKLIINPIEQALREVDGIKKIQSNAVANQAGIIITLDPDARNINKTNTDIQRAVDRVDDLPKEVDRPIVTVLESGQSPVIELTLFSGTIPELKLRELAQKTADELSLLPGVSKVTKQAWRKLEWIVSLDQNLLQRHHVSLNEVIQALGNQNIQIPAGDIIVDNGREIAVKTDGEYKTASDISKTVVRSNFQGNRITIADVGKIEERLEKPTILYRTNGVPGFSMIIAKKEKADALKIVQLVREHMEVISKKFPPGIEYKFVNDFTEYLKNRVSILSGNLFIGVFLVLAILAFFFPWRVALVVALGIPFSILASMFILEKLGFSINLISLMGLIVVTGMLVDDAIVVVENIYRKIESGLDLNTSIVTGTTEMVPAVSASVLTTIAAFSPLLFMSGIFGKFIFQIPVMVIIPLLVSLFESIFIAPGHFKDIVGERKKTTSKENDNHWYDRFLPIYRRFVQWTVVYRYKTFSSFVLILAITGITAFNMRFILFPPDGVYSFYIRVDGNPGSSHEEMSKVLTKIEPYIKSLPSNELRDFVTYIGIQQNDPNDPLAKRASHYGQIRINLTPESDRDRKVNEVVEELRKKIPTPDGVLRMQFEIARAGPPQGRPVSINVLGDDFFTIRKVADELKSILKNIKGVTDIEDSEVIGKNEIKVIPDINKVSEVGLTSADVANTLRAVFAGIVATTTRNLDEEINIRVQVSSLQENQIQQLSKVRVGTKTGGLVPLDQIVQFEENPSRLVVQHEKYKRLLNVSAQVDLNQTTAIAANQELKLKLQDLENQFQNIKLSFSGEDEDTKESMQSLLKSFFMAALMIFAILILTFSSLIQPLLVMVSIPLGLTGTIWALLLHGRPISFLAMIGMVALAGVIVNNVIVFIDFYNHLRKEKKGIDESLVEAATTRLRPIILTSVTTVLGLFPTAYGIGGQDGFVMSLALALGWGLAVGSVLSVLFFPAITSIVEHIRARFIKS